MYGASQAPCPGKDEIRLNLVQVVSMFLIAVRDGHHNHNKLTVITSQHLKTYSLLNTSDQRVSK